MAPKLQSARVRIPCSTSNLGAGFDCIGLALDRYLEARYEPGPDPLRVERRGTVASLDVPADRDLLVGAFLRALRSGADVSEPRGWIVMDSEIPVARGLGSSAAGVVAGLALAEAALGRDATPEARSRWLRDADALEGHPDNAAPVIFGGLVAVARDASGRPVPISLPLAPEIGFAFAAPPVEVSTREARRVLPESVPHVVASAALGRVAALLHGLATADPELLAIGFQDDLHVPYRLPLIPGAEHAVATALEAGAWAVTISGSGSGLIAVCARERAPAVADALTLGFRQAGFDAGSPEGRDPGAVVAFAASPDRNGAQIGGPAWR